MDTLKICIFTPRNSWMYQYSYELSLLLTNEKYTVSLHNELLNETGDIAFYLSYPKILNPTQLKQFSHNIVVHFSNIPQGKGWSPASWQILEGKNTIPLTLFEATEKVDSGKIYLKDIITLDGNELVNDWRTKLGIKTITMCFQFLHSFPELKNFGTLPQGKETFYPKRTPIDSKLDPNKSLNEQFNLLRIVDNENYPAFFYHNNKKYILKIFQED